MGSSYVSGAPNSFSTDSSPITYEARTPIPQRKCEWSLTPSIPPPDTFQIISEARVSKI